MYKKRTFKWVKLTATNIPTGTIRSETFVHQRLINLVFTPIHDQIDNQIKSIITHENRNDQKL